MSADNDNQPDQKERLADLSVLEGKIESFREREVELEVDCITAQTAVEHDKPQRMAGVEVRTAAAIVLSLDRKRALSQSRAQRRDEGEKKSVHLRAGVDALQAWLEAGESGKDQGSPGAVKGVFMVVTLVAIAAAIAVHWAFLILLVPIGATSAMMWSGNDASWQRVGAKRHFEQTGLSSPDNWTAEGVAEHIHMLQQLIASTSGAGSGQDGDTPHEGDSREDVEQELAALLDSVGLTESNLDETAEGELRLISRSFIARRELDEVKGALARISAEAEAIRTGVYRYLNRQGVGPGEGRADIATLRAGLARLGKD